MAGQGYINTLFLMRELIISMDWRTGTDLTIHNKHQAYQAICRSGNTGCS